MSRTLTVAQLAAISAKDIRPAVFVFMDFLDTPIRVWSGVGDFAWGGNTYSGLGALGGISEIEETGNPVANGLTLTLTGIPSEYISLAMNRRLYRGRKVRVWQGFFQNTGETGVLIDTPVQVFAGRMDVMTPTDRGETSTIALTCENRLIDLDRPRERRRTDQDQRMRASGDASFRYVAGLQDKEFNWGQGAGAGTGAATPGKVVNGRVAM